MNQNHKIFTYLITFLSLFVHLALANNVSVSGNIVDKVSENELPEVMIYITNLNSGSIDSALTNSSGYWEYGFSPTSVNEAKDVPLRFSVSQNYPNPFNPATRIRFLIPKSDVVKITVYNTLGEVVDSREEYLKAGSFSIMWSSKGSAGVYFFNIKCNSGSITKKMTQLDGGQGTGLSVFRSDRIPDNLSKIQSTIPVKISTKKFGYLSHKIETEIHGGEFFEFSIETIHSHSLLVDLHNDVLEKMIVNSNYHLADYHNYNHSDIPRFITGGVDVQFFAVWVDPYSHGHDSYNNALSMIDIFNFEMSLNSESIQQARTASEAITITNDNKIAAVIGVEGGHAIEDDLGKLITLYGAGMRYLTITWNNSTNWAISAKDTRSTTVGLSQFGKQVIRTLDSLGVIIDVSHTGIKAIKDILDITTNPIIATHSGVRALRNHYRNLYDDQIVAIANTGGVIGVVFYPPYLSNTGSTDIAKVADHIDYIVNLVGIDYAAIGSDFDGIGNNTVDGLENVTKFPDLTLELLKRGYSQVDIGKINGGNFMRAFEDVCGQ